MADNITLAVEEVFNRFGMEVLLDSGRFCAILDDTAPQSDTERKVFRRMQRLDLFPKVYHILQKDTAPIQSGRIDMLLKDEGFILEWRRTALMAFGLPVPEEPAESAVQSAAPAPAGHEKKPEAVHQEPPGNINPVENTVVPPAAPVQAPPSPASNRVILNYKPVIKSVNSIGGNDINNAFPVGMYSSVINIDQFKCVYFHVFLQRPIGVSGELDFRILIYDSNDNLVSDLNSTVKCAPNHDKFSKGLILKGDDGSSMSPGKYTAKITIENSETFTYRFELVDFTPQSRPKKKGFFASIFGR